MSGKPLAMRATLPVALGLACAATSTGAAASISGSVDFEHDPAGTTYGSGTHAPGDVAFSVFTTDGPMDIRVQPLAVGGTTTFNTATLGGFADAAFPTQAATLSNIALQFDLLSAWSPGTIDYGRFDFADFGGVSNLEINGDLVQLNGFDNVPTTLGGVDIRVNFGLPGAPGVNRQGEIELMGPLNDVRIGGQELGIDTVWFVGSSGLPGDYDASGVVSGSDLDLVLLNWGEPASPAPPGWEFDLPDGLIDQDELDDVLQNWGSGLFALDGAASPLPEPGALTLLPLSVAAWARARRDEPR